MITFLLAIPYVIQVNDTGTLTYMINVTNVLLVDDCRDADFIEKAYGIRPTNVAKTYDEAIQIIQTKHFNIIMMDHDLGCFDKDGKEYNGTHVLTFIEPNPQYKPDDFIMVSANPVGRKNMQIIIDRILTKK